MTYLQDLIIKNIIIDSLKYCRDEKGLKIYGWCLMTNHIHLIVSAKQGFKLSDILRDFKKYTAKTILKNLQANPKESRRSWMLWMFKKAGQQNSNNTTFQFWRQDNHPVEVTSSRFLHQKMEYIHYNPVKEGFCYKPEDYPYSSTL
ncbi:MAG: transposase [Balneola sp.]